MHLLSFEKKKISSLVLIENPKIEIAPKVHLLLSPKDTILNIRYSISRKVAKEKSKSKNGVPRYESGDSLLKTGQAEMTVINRPSIDINTRIVLRIHLLSANDTEPNA